MSRNKGDVVEGKITVRMPQVNIRPDGDVDLVQIEKDGVCIGLTIEQCRSLAKYFEEKLPQ